MIMMSFCKNTLHTFLGFSPTSTPTPTLPPHYLDITRYSSTNHRNNLVPVTGLITVTEKSPHKLPANILESSTLKPSSISTATKQDSGAGSGGSLVEITCHGGGSIDRLSSCTESLGFESSEQMEEIIHESSSSSRSQKLRMNANTTTSSSTIIDCRKTKDGMFPPVLSSLRRNDGHKNYTSFLKPVRENGRLVLTQVTISRPDVFRVSRQDGRLILQFINQKKSQESNEEEKQQVVEKQQVKESCSISGCGVEWKIPAASSSGGGGEDHQISLSSSEEIRYATLREHFLLRRV
ncbi:Fantastic four 3-like [Thalictrum thalictroides]|uniref:Fantastic four 3-like n=1 Tax=Thalictrum thalictroides TaxID=46969 RepID=A0A7J6XE66_THATH|nr:Fantastic four 3-like [Thalictrum thalictroides]